MRLFAAFLVSSALSFFDSIHASSVLSSSDITSVCHDIARSVSNATDVFFPDDTSGHYAADIDHYALTSIQNSTCSVEPGTPHDVGIIVRILGKNRAPFAVKGGGHATNPGFSSTEGVQIALTRFNKVAYHAQKQTVDVGTGLIWDDVYAQLEPHGVIVVGGRVSGVGVAGFSMGGGYSYLTNQHGLTLDNILAYELVLPNGTVTTVTEHANPDLFFGLRGGSNNFGIVTKLTMKAYPQGQVWGGAIFVAGTLKDQVNAATLKFVQEVTDPKAAILPSFSFAAAAGGLIASLILFYDGPTPPQGVFDDFLAIPALTTDISTRSYLSVIQATPINQTAGLRSFYHTAPTPAYDATFLAAAANETLFFGTELTAANASLVDFSWSIEPFLSSILTHGPSTASAYPPLRPTRFQPTNLNIAWTDPAFDDTMHNTIKTSVANLARIGNTPDDAPLYGNYAIFDTPVRKIYGGNLKRLKGIKRAYDPEDVMGLAGGWKF